MSETAKARAKMMQITDALESLWTRWCYVDEALNSVGHKGRSDAKLATRIVTLALSAVEESEGGESIELEELKLTIKAMLVRNRQLVKGTLTKTNEDLSSFNLKIALTKQGEVWLGRESDEGVFVARTCLHSRPDLDEAQTLVANFNKGLIAVEDEDYAPIALPIATTAAVA